MNRILLPACLLDFAVLTNLAFAEEAEIRPSFLFTTETAGVLAPSQWVISAFGGGSSGTRLSYGVFDGLEARADLSWTNELGTAGVGNAFSGAGTAKYHIWDNGMVGVGALGKFGGANAGAGTTVNSFVDAEIPLTFNHSAFLVTVIPKYTRFLPSSFSGVYGVDAGVAVPI